MSVFKVIEILKYSRTWCLFILCLSILLKVRALFCKQMEDDLYFQKVHTFGMEHPLVSAAVSLWHDLCGKTIPRATVG